MNLSNHTYPISGDHRKISGANQTWLSPILARLHQAAAWWAEINARRRELDELQRFTDRELWDVGLSRSDILSIERGTYRRD